MTGLTPADGAVTEPKPVLICGCGRTIVMGMIGESLNRRKMVKSAAAIGAASLAPGAGQALGELRLADLDPYRQSTSVYPLIRAGLFQLEPVKDLVSRIWRAFENGGDPALGDWALLYWFNYWRLVELGQERVRAARVGKKMARKVLVANGGSPLTKFWLASFAGLEVIALGVLNAAQMIPDIKAAFEDVNREQPDLYYANALVGLAKIYVKAPTFPVSVGDLEKGRLYLDLAETHQRGKFALWYLFRAEYEIVTGNQAAAFAILDSMATEVKPADIASAIILDTTLIDARSLQREVEAGSYNKYNWDPMFTPLKLD